MYPAMCKEREEWPFNPALEGETLLRDWLAYRGYRRNEMEEKTLRDYAEADFAEHFPPFAQFVEWDVVDASMPFLVAWLSQYGVGSQQYEEREWWEDRVEKLKPLVKPWKKPRNPFVRQEEVETEEIMLDEVLLALDKCLLSLPVRKETEKAIIKVQKKRSIRQWNKKRLLSYLLIGAAVAVPMLYNARKGKYQIGGGSSARFMEVMKTNAGRAMVPVAVGLAAARIGEELDIPANVSAPLVTAAAAEMINSSGLIPLQVVQVLLRMKFQNPLLLSFVGDVLLPSLNDSVVSGPSLWPGGSFLPPS